MCIFVYERTNRTRYLVVVSLPCYSFRTAMKTLCCSVAFACYKYKYQTHSLQITCNLQPIVFWIPVILSWIHRKRIMDFLPCGGIFNELKILHETGCFSAKPSLEESWHQVGLAVTYIIPLIWHINISLNSRCTNLKKMLYFVVTYREPYNICNIEWRKRQCWLGKWHWPN